MTEAMKITLSTQPADGRWGEKATWSINNDGIALHLNGKDDLGLIQRAARKIDGMGIKHVALSGEGWNTDRAWAFWAGYKGPKGQRQVEWPSLDDAQRSELDNRLTIIDWVRDTINAPAEELGPEQLAQRAVDLLCGVAGEKISYRITPAVQRFPPHLAGRECAFAAADLPFRQRQFTKHGVEQRGRCHGVIDTLVAQSRG